ncbi:hypothetical protein [Catenulispora subtropica]|uniref:Uncharacterized protein n=1 Tax=Catenulispora subtropica TaxID=450798 RepID=A0ABN2THA4_9ACTN
MDDVAPDQLSRLWDDHLRHPFPARLRGKDVGEIDFIMLDADIAGCIQTLLSRGSLDEWRTAVLNRCLGHLAIVLPLLTDEDELAYYDRLRTMAGLALDWQRERANLA